MTDKSSSTFRYQIGGSLVPESPTYIVRQADRDLFNALLAKEYCYILNARQMGKSSLRVRTMGMLEKRGIACTEIELSGIGSQQITSRQWYGGIIQEIIDGFELRINRRSWWREREDLSPVQRLRELIETVLLKQVTGDIVIFIDEIDSILSLDFATDDFLGLIHNFYNKRASKPEYRRLTFALLGVATPRELMQDRRATPFNIGRAIEMKGFKLAESMPLALGFGDRFSNTHEIMERILFWTGGQPFLTQKLCRLVKQHTRISDLAALDELVKTNIVQNWESQDDPEHLRTIRDRLCRYANRHSVGNVKDNSSQELLKIYRKVRRWGRIRAKDSQEHLELQLSGAVATEENRLVVKNQIYQAVFDLNWVDRQLEDLNENQFNSLPFGKILLISLAIASSVLGMRSLGWLESRELQLFNLMMRIRPVEPPDPRILLVTITQDDIHFQPAAERDGASISDYSLAQLLTKLERSSAEMVGLDIYRESPLAAEHQSSIDRVRQSDRFVAICNYGDRILASPQIISQDGFNDLFLDSDGIVRRQMLAVDDAQPCKSKYSFSWTLAADYLSRQGFEEKEKYLQLGNRQFVPLEDNTGGYQQLDNRGNQILLNCRNSPQIAEKVTLGEFLNDDFNLERVRERLVIIGTTAPNFNDNWRTACFDSETGVEVNAQMTSQILSHILDNRPLLWSLSEPLEILTIIACSFLPGLFYHYSLSYSQFAKVIAITTFVILVSGEVLLIVQGLWLPVLPLLIALITTGSSLWIYQNRLDQNS